MEIKIRITNRAAYIVSTAMLILVLAMFAYAGRPTDKAGHWADDVWVDVNGKEMTLQEAVQTKIEENFKFKVTSDAVTANPSSGRDLSVPSGYSIEKCAIITAPEDMHVGSRKTDMFADQSHWNNNHYAGTQAVYTEDNGKWNLKCRYGFTFYDDANKKSEGDGYNLQWRSGACDYLTICKPTGVVRYNFGGSGGAPPGGSGGAGGEGQSENSVYLR